MEMLLFDTVHQTNCLLCLYVG